MYQQQPSFLQYQSQPILSLKPTHLRPSNPTFFQPSINPPIKKSAQPQPILSLNKLSNKLQVNEGFLDMLGKMDNNQMIGVGVVGTRKCGKSFLIDCLVSHEQKSISRVMTKSNRQLVTMPTLTLKARSGENIFLFDSDSNTSNQTFLWIYFVSSVIVLNLNVNDRTGQEDFLKNLSFLQSHMDSNPQDLSLPKLIIVRRDADQNLVSQKEFKKRIQQYQLFEQQITSHCLSYPGSQTISTKQICHVPQSSLSKSFLGQISKLCSLIKLQSHAKQFRGNLLGPKILSLTLDPLTLHINKDRKVNTIKIWDQVIQTLAVGYYNFYVTKYGEELQKQFGDQKPSDKYTLYKKLTNVRRTVDKKVQGFNTIQNDPIFQKYKEKLNQKIISKQNIIKEINKQKSKKQNDKYCKNLFKQMDDANCARLIQEYCKTNLDDQKTQVLLENFQSIINQRIKDMQKSKDPAKKPSKQIQALQEQLQQIQEQLARQKKVSVGVVSYDFQGMQSSLTNKQKQLSLLQKQLQVQKQASSKKKISQNKDITQLQQSIQLLKKKTISQQQQISILRKDRQQKLRKMTQQLNQQLKNQEIKLKKLQEMVKNAKQSNLNVKGAKEGAKNNGCCQLM